jgi:hypothetical protein
MLGAKGQSIFVGGFDLSVMPAKGGISSHASKLV